MATACGMAAERLRAAGMTADAVTLDVRDAAAVQAAIGETARRAGRLDVVFANAGISAGPGYALMPEGRLEAISLAAWENVLKVNLTGVMLTLQAAAASMKTQRSGRIIVTASISGLRSETVSGYGYVATKAAVINLVRHAARELGRDNILVNAIAPGYFYTNLAGGRLAERAGNGAAPGGHRSPRPLRRGRGTEGPRRVPRLAGLELHHRHSDSYRWRRFGRLA